MTRTLTNILTLPLVIALMTVIAATFAVGMILSTTYHWIMWRKL
jgi:hypothetical protein